MSTKPDRFWAPVFEDDRGNQLVILHGQYMGETKEEAERIKLGCMMVECIILRLKPLGVREFGEGIEAKNFQGYITGTAVRHPMKITFLAGPMFDEAMAASNSTEKTNEVTE